MRNVWNTFCENMAIFYIKSKGKPNLGYRWLARKI